MKKEIQVYLDDILESIAKIEEYRDGITFEKFDRDTELQDACVRRLEIIGEAVKRLSGDLKRKNTDVPWKQIAGMRDILIHEYAGVSLERVWGAIVNDLPLLKKAIQRIEREIKK